jgi:ABC-2 type transport system ATP-binding protein
MAHAANPRNDCIRVEQLTHRYPRSTDAALESIDLRIPTGSTFGLLGPNGAGKTTLLSILTGLLPPQSGSIQIAGHDLRGDTRDVKSISALVPQEYAFYPDLTGRENLRFFADVYALTPAQWRERFEYCVQVCRLEEMLDKRAVRYSGGMKRRLNLALGLLNAPQILYLDEPTVGIDARSRQLIVEAIASMRSRGTTVIYTSHYMEEIEALCDELAIINQGRVVMRDATVNLLQRGQDKTLLLTFASAPDSAVLEALRQWQPQALQGLQYALSLGDAADVETVLRQCAAQKVVVTQMQFGISKLERIYLSLLDRDAANPQRDGEARS